MPFGREQPEQHVVDEVTVDPGRAAHGALEDEPRFHRSTLHGAVVGERLGLQPMKPQDRETVGAENTDDVGTESATSKRRE